MNQTPSDKLPDDAVKTPENVQASPDKQPEPTLPAAENKAETAVGTPSPDSGEAAAAPAEEKPKELTVEEKTDSLLPKLFTVTSSPHIRTADTSRSIMIDVCIALMPALIWGIYVFGLRALTITLISVVFAVASEFLWEKLMKKPITVLDFSAVVTGLLLALNLPVTVPLWMPAVGSIFAIIVVKQLFGGIGKNFVNPALAARVFLLLAWSAPMSSFTKAGSPYFSAFRISLPQDSVDAVAGATPLALLKNGTIPSSPSLFNMFIGYESGTIGEVSALLLTAGFLYLLVRRVVTWHIPVCYIGTVLIITFVFTKNSLPFDFALSQVLSGGLFLGAVFMATDYATSPITNTGRVVFGVGCGLLTVFIRYFGGLNEGVSFAILIMNLLVWYIDRYTKPVRFGGASVDRAKK